MSVNQQTEQAYREVRSRLWRLAGPDGLAELGWDEAREDVVLVEWPDRLGPLRPADALEVALWSTEGEARRARLSGWPDRIGRLR